MVKREGFTNLWSLLTFTIKHKCSFFVFVLNMVVCVIRWLGGPGSFQDVIPQWRSHRAGTASLQTGYQWFVCKFFLLLCLYNVR